MKNFVFFFWHDSYDIRVAIKVQDQTVWHCWLGTILSKKKLKIIAFDLDIPWINLINSINIFYYFGFIFDLKKLCLFFLQKFNKN
ncbi:hypothetical protein BpHYR1_036809 [Brachionus plicatilis]|uniref:Uncharacterized protein n=1 Tax=Brachionus plicatilis TaxID=10195 RepID=A0A3M7SHU3_BRAPC|nr:hypothetical protein BpHYR1_036809 [Brachionus plicatilis]